MKWLLVQLFYAKVAIESSKEMVQPCNKGKNSTKTMPCWALLVLTISFEIHLAYFFFFLQISDIVQIFFPIDPCFSMFLSQILSSSVITQYILFSLFQGEITSQYLMNFSLRTQISLGMWTLASQVLPKYLCHFGFWNFNEGLYVK